MLTENNRPGRRCLIRALTLYEPFATLIAAGAKRTETRGWRTTYRGPLAVHAARRWERDTQEDCLAARSLLREHRFVPPTAAHALAAERAWGETLGRVLCVARLVDCRLVPRPPADALDAEFGTFGPGRWGWVLEDVRPLGDPVAVRGGMGLWELPPDVAAAVEAQLKGEVPGC